jgi:hypothetical protein
MAVHEGSRYTHVEGRTDLSGRMFLTERVPFRFRALRDNRVHVVSQGDTLFTIAGRYFQPLLRPAGYWWAIADFQPNPIHDPTIQLVAGSVVIVPSVRTLLEDVLGDRGRNA